MSNDKPYDDTEWDGLDSSWDKWKLEQLRARLQTAVRELAEARKALLFYAKREHWDSPHTQSQRKLLIAESNNGWDIAEQYFVGNI